MIASMRPSALVLLAVAMVGAEARAQAVRGRVVTPDSVAVPGAIVTLLDSAGTPLARALADDAGRFAMRLPAAGRYGFQVLRLGFAPTHAAALRVERGQEAERTLVLTGAPIPLRAVQVTAEQQCVGADSASAAFAVWEEARKALLASQLTRMTRAYTMDVEMFVSRQSADRMLPPTNRRSEMLGTRLRALTPVPPEQLVREGYLERGPTGERYFAPDEDVLLSESFASTHCMRLIPTDSASGVLRLGFVPRPGRTVPDIRGVMTVDRATSELRRLDFMYTGLRITEQPGDPGGEIIYRRLPEGSWIIEYWALVLPFVEQYVRQQAIPPMVSRNGQSTPGRPAVIAEGLGRVTSGGGVTRIRFGDTILWAATEPPGPHPPVQLPPMRY
ncbi:MAG: hypothetical protein JWN79_1948 [Gemmatimonadetes bacterium]|jgi:hypothetical protein|nr:hypothetical protein [Gemmatimonadota bacterium]